MRTVLASPEGIGRVNVGEIKTRLQTHQDVESLLRLIGFESSQHRDESLHGARALRVRGHRALRDPDFGEFIYFQF